MKLTKRKLQAIKSKQNILEKALPLIKENGFDHVSVDDICSSAGIAKGTFYHYFASKEKIFGETGIMMNDIEIDHLLNDEKMPSIDKVFYLIHAYMELANGQGVDITRQLFKSFLDGNDIYTEETSGTQMLREIIIEGHENKQINPNLTTDEIVDLVFAFTAGLILYWLNSGGDYDLSEKSNILFEKWLRHTLAYNQ